MPRELPDCDDPKSGKDSRHDPCKTTDCEHSPLLT
jgi:hypothetical protein